MIDVDSGGTYDGLTSSPDDIPCTSEGDACWFLFDAQIYILICIICHILRSLRSIVSKSFPDITITFSTCPFETIAKIWESTSKLTKE